MALYFLNKSGAFGRAPPQPRTRDAGRSGTSCHGWCGPLPRFPLTWARLRPGAVLSLDLPYPSWLGYWPAVLVFWSFAWFELVPEAAEKPASLAAAILAYSLVTWAGMVLFGRAVWLRHGEAFAMAFGLLARFAPLAVRRMLEWGAAAEGTDRNSSDDRPRLVLRPYGVGLLTRTPVPLSHVVFVLLMLATVTFDGVTETPAWRSAPNRFRTCWTASTRGSSCLPPKAKPMRCYMRFRNALRIHCSGLRWT